MPAPVVRDLRIEVSPEEAARYLGYPRGRHRPARGATRLAELMPRALSLLRPRGAYALVSRAQAAAAGMPDPAARVGVAAVTIGSALEDEVSRCVATNAVLDALVLDSIGSAAAEAAADELNLELCSIASSEGLEAAARVSPGYGGWDTGAQGALLALLPTDELGITLTSGSMMVPRKSVSFAVAFETPGRGVAHGASRCRRCGLIRCRHRITPTDCG
ncbi:MAG TPA: vitamin B12 dependent-methionine synthase activation domain-containing protein [Thermoanaerobaculaceae bacterium]|nr:vitamin B12 dependent-methionine synthase activation domain-containing protein [Thermoanaerobaculaceae bacterium]